MKEVLDALDRLVSSPFVALILTLLAVYFLWRLYNSERNENRSDNRKQWEIVAELTAAQKDSNMINEKSLDAVERARA